ncbi:hypothetical protein HDV05_003836 [Chytridiales sp. JEL 0842]|nr:hypothetical protein HDV05_003836 [Chytridiales sp. JEL 0842]
MLVSAVFVAAAMASSVAAKFYPVDVINYIYKDVPARVEVGDTIIFNFQGHNVVGEDPNQPCVRGGPYADMFSGEPRAVRQYNYTFTKRGIAQFFCTPHCESDDMRARVGVGMNLPAVVTTLPPVVVPTTTVRPPVTTTVPSVPAGATYTATVANFAFRNLPASINVGDTVVFQFTQGRHNVIAENPARRCSAATASIAGAEVFNSGNPGAVSTFTWKFTKPGTQSFYCAPHCNSSGMRGSVEVKAAPAARR